MSSPLICVRTFYPRLLKKTGVIGMIVWKVEQSGGKCNMFMGEYAHSLDPKGRVIIPSKFRESLGSRCVITRSLDRCLCIYAMEDWEKFVARLSDIPYNVKKQRQLVRFFLSGANEAEPDRQGRILIPANLREAAGIDRDVLLVGVGSRIEIWSKDAWEENMSSEEINEIAEEMLGNGFEI